jgi:hypothetical protein
VPSVLLDFEVVDERVSLAGFFTTESAEGAEAGCRRISGSRIRTTSFPSVSVLSVLSVVKTSPPLAGLAVTFSTSGAEES